MKKILIVGENLLITETLKVAFDKNKFACAISNCEEALNNFFSEEPAIIIVCDSDIKKGALAFADLKNSSANEEKIIGIGFGKITSDDYLKMPFELKNLFERLGI